METMANFLDQKFDELTSFNLPELVKVIRRHLMTETDFTAELRNMKIAAQKTGTTRKFIGERLQSPDNSNHHGCDHHGFFNDHHDWNWKLSVWFSSHGRDRLSAIRRFGLMVDHYHHR